MEITLSAFLAILSIVNLYTCFLINKKIKDFSIEILHLQNLQHRVADKLNKNTTELSFTSQKIDGIASSFDRLLALRDNLETTRPIKPNNWDSIREAFKGPTRVEINE